MLEALYRRAIDALNDHDVDRFLAFCHPEIEFRSLVMKVQGGAYRGHDGIRQYFSDMAETIPDMRVELLDVEERGAWVIAAERGHGTGTASGAPVDWEIVQAARVEGGLCTFAVTELDREAALAAAGIE